jgi:hypothetical protein
MGNSQKMVYSFYLDFDPNDVDHRRVAHWLANQYDPADAVVRLVKAANEGEQRLLQWEELAALLTNELREVRTQFSNGQSRGTKTSDQQEDPESARRLDSMFE